MKTIINLQKRYCHISRSDQIMETTHPVTGTKILFLDTLA